MTVVVDWFLWPCSVVSLLLRAPTPSTARSTQPGVHGMASSSSPVEQLRRRMRTLEQRAERHRLDAHHFESTLVSYHLSRREATAPTLLRSLNSGERERVRSLLARRERRLAESVRCERMALVLDQQLASLASTASLVDVVGTLRVANMTQRRLRRALEAPDGSGHRPPIDELVDALADNEDVAASYAAALSRGDALLLLDGDAVDNELEQLVVDSASSATIEAAARSLVERAPPVPTHEPETAELMASAMPV